MNKKQRDDGDTSEEEVPVEPSGESFGTWLRRQREGREIELREIADASKIGLRYLQAFEEDRFDILPAPIFAKGFLRQYAKFVGLDPEEVVNFYLSACQDADEQDSMAGQVPVSNRRPRSTWFLLAGAGILIMLFWWLLNKEERTARKETEIETPNSSMAAEATEPMDSSLVTGGLGDSGLPDSSPPDGTSPGVASPGIESPPPAKAAEESSAIRVVLDFSSDCWIEASIDGVKRLAETKVQGESMILGAEKLVELTIGDVKAVQISVNELPFPLTPRRGSTVLEVSIDLDTLANLRSDQSRT